MTAFHQSHLKLFNLVSSVLSEYKWVSCELRTQNKVNKVDKKHCNIAKYFNEVNKLSNRNKKKQFVSIFSSTGSVQRRVDIDVVK